MSNRNPSPLEFGFSFGGPILRTLSPSVRSKVPLLPIQTELNSDRYWMLEAIQESQNSIGITNPNPSVGCILVDSQGQEISRGSTQAYLKAHAERVALSQVSDMTRLQNATAYVTLEPCSHFGNQPPCVDLLVNSPISRVVVARPDPNPKVNGEGIRKLIQAGKKVEIGLYHSETTAWNFPFFAYQNLKRPVVALKWAQTLDGQLADDTGKSQWITDQPARSYTHWLRQRYDAILVGAKTVLTDHPKLNVRDCALPHQSQPLPIIFDPHGIFFNIHREEQAKLKNSTFHRDRFVVLLTPVQVQQKYDSSWLKNLENLFPIFLQDPFSISEAMGHLSGSDVEKKLGHPLQSIFVEGGPRTLTLFLQSGYADLLHVFIAPILTGGQTHRVSLQKTLAEKLAYSILSSSQLGPDQLLELVHQDHLDLFQINQL